MSIHPYMLHDLEDNPIINKLKQGDVISFDYIFRKYNKRVYYFAISYIKNKEDAQDIVQEVFMNLWKHRDQIKEYYVFSSYLFRITYNTTCKRFRKQASDKRHLEEVLKTNSNEDNTTKLDIEYINLVETTNQLLEKLPFRQKKILLLSIEEQLSTEQIALKLNISIKTVENYLAMARSSLRKYLAVGGILSVLYFWLFLK